MKRLLTLLLMPFAIQAQELLKDPGVEALQFCPGGISMLNASVFWYSPTKGTPDLFNKCSGKHSQVAVPNNICGKQKPFDGNGYAGLILFESQYYDYKEYLQTELSMPLKKGSRYKLTFHISLADNSMYAVDKIEAAFTSSRKFFNDHTTMTNVTPQISFEGTNKGFFTDRKSWVQLSAEYVAKGGERYITIGNFVLNRHGKRIQVKKFSDVSSAYYYLDGISVMLVSESSESESDEVPTPEALDPIEQKDTLAPGSSFILRAILFETDKDVLLPQSYKELDRLVSILRKFPLLELEVRGHTDGQASEEHNQDLSERRAKAVKKYLVSTGIQSYRLTTKGFGEPMPVADNNTEKGRAFNRRVEFMVMKR